jgi:hypothetical protein
MIQNNVLVDSIRELRKGPLWIHLLLVTRLLYLVFEQVDGYTRDGIFGVEKRRVNENKML